MTVVFDHGAITMPVILRHARCPKMQGPDILYRYFGHKPAVVAPAVLGLAKRRAVRHRAPRQRAARAVLIHGSKGHERLRAVRAGPEHARTNGPAFISRHVG